MNGSEDMRPVPAWRPIDEACAVSEEVITWHHLPAMPDSDLTVLLWVRYDDGEDWCAGWLDGQDWLDCASGGVIAGTVVA
jgi:hypothetical protein